MFADSKRCASPRSSVRPFRISGVLWDLWTGTVNPLRVNEVDRNPIYDVQARAMMHGHLWLPAGSIGEEAFVSNGHEYTYFGIFLSLLRILVSVFTHSLDGRFFSVSILGAWITTAVFCSLLLWRLRVFLRGLPRSAAQGTLLRRGPLRWVVPGLAHREHASVSSAADRRRPS